jgi:hypothetical protein
MPQFSVSGNQATNTTTYKSAIGAFCASTGTVRRGRVYDFSVGPQTAPNSTDCTIQFDLSRITTSGAYTVSSVNQADTNDAAFTGIGASNYTTEPTITSSSQVWNNGANQRAPMRWVASGPDAEFVWPATLQNGFVLRSLSTQFTGATGGTISCRE